jgi:uncharacterized membrane protein YgcG
MAMLVKERSIGARAASHRARSGFHGCGAKSGCGGRAGDWQGKQG